MNIFSEQIDVSLFQQRIDNLLSPAKPSLDEETAEQIVDLLAKAELPAVYAGGGVIAADACDELKGLVEHFEMPVLYTLMERVLFPTPILSRSA